MHSADNAASRSVVRSGSDLRVDVAADREAACAGARISTAVLPARGCARTPRAVPERTSGLGRSSIATDSAGDGAAGAVEAATLSGIGPSSGIATGGVSFATGSAGVTVCGADGAEAVCG
jgi:hypothetical protein